MAGYFSEADFYLQQHNDDNRWKGAFTAALVLHVVLFVWSLYFPDFIARNPLLEEAITVDLVSLPVPSGGAGVEAPKPPPQAVKQPDPPAPAPQPKEPEEPTVVIPDEKVPPPQPVVEAKPISVKPRKIKKKIAQDTRLAEEIERQKQADALRETLRKEEQRRIAERERKRKAAEQEKKRRAEALARAEQAQREAEQAARDARKALADMYRSQGSVQKPATSTTGSQASGRSGQGPSVPELQYYSNVAQHLRNYWVLLDVRKWSANTNAIVVVTVNRNGQVLRIKFDKRSGDQFFDQQVMNTVNKAAPMPKFPGIIKEKTIEFELTFRPGKLEM